MTKKKYQPTRLGPDLLRCYLRITMILVLVLCLTTPALAGLMSAIAVLGAKLSNNQHKVDQAWDWLKRIWICWAIINGIGAFIAYIVPKFSGLATLTP